MDIMVLLAVGAGGLALYNLGKTNADWLEAPQLRLERIRGNKHANINLSNIISKWSPMYDPRRFTACETFDKRVRTRLMADSPNPLVREAGADLVQKYDYRKGSGAVGASPALVYTNKV
jgi:hypothetical protein